MRSPACLPVVAVLAVLSAAGCGSSSTTPTSGAPPEQDKGLDPGAQTGVESAGKNPDGVAYPTAGIGTKAGTHTATKVGKPGDKIANFKFLGYVDSDKSALKTFSLADFYDPQAKKYKIVHFQAAGIWCGFCKLEAQLLAPIADGPRAKGVVMITTVAEGKTGGTPSVLADLDWWVDAHKTSYTVALDPGNQNLGIFYTAAALPWNAWVDPRTMEILEAHEGGYGSGTTSENVKTEWEGWLNFVTNV